MESKYKIFSPLALLLLCCFMWGVVEAQQNTVKKEVTKSISLTGSPVLTIINRYGNIRIHQWTQKRTLVRVQVNGEASDSHKAAMLAAAAKINERRWVDSIILETGIDTSLLKKIASTTGRCRVKYDVYVSPGARLLLINSFGEINAGDYHGRLQVTQQFGNFSGGKLTGSSLIKIEQGDINIERLENSRIEIKGFQSVRVRNVSGAFSGHFSLGNKADIGLSQGLTKLSIEADNVNPLNLTGLKSAGADLKVHTDASKLISNGQIQFRIEKGAPEKTDSASSRSDLLTLKKLKSDSSFKKANDYHIPFGAAAIPVGLNVSFCVVKVFD